MNAPTSPLRTLASLLLVSALGSTGCVQGGPKTVDPLETHPRPIGTFEPWMARSGVIIRTETFLDPNVSNTSEGYVTHHTGYTIYDWAGKRLSYVPNYQGFRSDDPSNVLLDPGKYLILLDKPGDRAPIFWVTVKNGLMTEIDVQDLPKAIPQP